MRFEIKTTVCIFLIMLVTTSCWKGEVGENSLITEAATHKALSINPGFFHNCALLSGDYGGRVKCWGKGSNGQIGNGRFDQNNYTPTFVEQLSTARAISAGFYKTCAVLENKTIQCWGDGSSYDLGNGKSDNQSTPVTVSNITTATGVSVGYSHTCALLDNKSIQCWGRGDYCQFGNCSVDEGTLSGNDNSSIPIGVTGISTATAVSTGYFHNCALLDNKSIQCWGIGFMGDNSTYNLTPGAVDKISTATGLSAGVFHTCAVLSSGTVQCWGDGEFGRLGNGSTDNASIPVTVSNISTATSVSAGFEHTCAVLSGGTVQCWGNGKSGRLGNGSTDNFSIPVTVSNISTATEVNVGYEHTCALLSGGEIMCWGANHEGQRGDSADRNSTDSLIPVKVRHFGG